MMGLFACSLFLHSISPSSASDWLVVPGRSVGHVRLGENLGAPDVAFGPEARPQEDRAAMGHIWHVWRTRAGHELDIYTERGADDSAAHPSNIVREIRVTSPTFHTEGGLRTGMPAARMPGFAVTPNENGPRLLDNVREGIALEIKGGKCAAIIVHPKGRPVNEIYLGFPYATGS